MYVYVWLCMYIYIYIHVCIWTGFKHLCIYWFQTPLYIYIFQTGFKHLWNWNLETKTNSGNALHYFTLLRGGCDPPYLLIRNPQLRLYNAKSGLINTPLLINLLLPFFLQFKNRWSPRINKHFGLPPINQPPILKSIFLSSISYFQFLLFPILFYFFHHHYYT